MQGIPVIVIGGFIGHANDGDDTVPFQNGEGQEIPQMDVTFRVALLEGVLRRVVVQENGATLTYGFSPDSRGGQVIAGLRIHHGAFGHDSPGPGIQHKLLALFTVGIDVADLAGG